MFGCSLLGQVSLPKNQAWSASLLYWLVSTLFNSITDGDWRIALASARARRAGASERMRESLKRESQPPPQEAQGFGNLDTAHIPSEPTPEFDLDR